jgi:stage V sporulation protein G
MQEIKITEVQISFIKPKDGLIAFASLVLNGQIYLGSIGIHKKLMQDDFRLTYPTKKTCQNDLNIFHPIKREVSLAIENAIKQKMKEVMLKGRTQPLNNEAGWRC